MKVVFFFNFKFKWPFVEKQMFYLKESVYTLIVHGIN